MKTTVHWLSLLLLTGCQQGSTPQRATLIRLQLGEQYLLVDDLASAERNFRRVTEVAADDYRGWLGLAEVARLQGYDSQATICYTQALKKAPENGRILNNYGAFLCTLGQYDKGRYLLKQAKATALPINRELAKLHMANCYLRQGELATAQAELDTVQGRSAPVMSTWLELAKQWKTAQHWANTGWWLTLYHQKFSPTAETLWLMVFVAAQQGQYAVVARYGEQLARNFPHSIQYQRYIANEY